jgi:hypothetical protein
MRVLILGVLILVLCSGCSLYQAKTMEENIAQIKALEGSGCIYFRGNSRPYADVSMMAVSTWGKNAPKYLECLQGIPPEARMLQLP